MAKFRYIIRSNAWICLQNATLWVCSSILTVSCNSVFYQPDPREFLNPSQVEIDYATYRTRTNDGVDVQLWHMKPSNLYGNQAPKGVVVQFHGNGENMSTHFLSVAWLTAVGYHVISFDYRGYGESDSKSPTRQGCIADGKAILNWIATRPDLKNQPLFVIGQSLGGAVAVPLLATEQIANLNGLILDSTFSSYRRITRQKLASLWVTWPLQWPLSFLVTDDDSPIDSIEVLKVPILAVHAPKDPVVPYNLGRELYERSTSVDKLFWDIDLGGHTAAFAVEGSKYREELVAWLQQHRSAQTVFFLKKYPNKKVNDP
ncbi:MAG: alpha/beta fold hydrolase [Proteobacteria bacterium]|nr:alpha/beta fold hydrolase [Pseudomonadota bacterium]